MAGGGDGAALVEGVDAGRLRAPGLHESTREDLRRCYGGQDGRGTTGNEESRWRSNSPAAVLGAIPAVARAGVAGEELGELPDGGAKLMRGLAGAGVRRSGGSTVGQGALRGGASGRWC
jgi:hypothetical protein